MSWREKLAQKTTERRQGQIEQQMDKLHGLFLTSSLVGVYVVNNKKFEFANPQFQKYTGFSQDALLGMDSLSLIYPAHLP